MSPFERDAVKAAGSYLARPVAILVAILVFGWAMDCHGKRSVVADQTYRARVDTVRITDSVYQAAKDTAKKAVVVAAKAKATSDQSDRPVTITNDSVITVVRHDTTIVTVVPPEITRDLADLRATKIEQAATIVLLSSGLAAADSTIHARDQLLATPKPQRHWGPAVSIGYGPQLEHDHSVRLGWHADVGLTWRF